MSDAHERFRQLAVGHVLGGLEPRDATAFRSHLLGCRDCRARVAELRGIASDLERAERDERARSMVRREAARHGPPAEQAGEPSEEHPARRPPEDAAPASRLRPGHVLLATVVVVIMAGAMAFWNLHLRTVNDQLTTVADQHSGTLDTLAGGVSMELESEPPVQGIAAVDGDRVAVALSGVETEEDARRLVLWLMEDGDATAVAQVLPRQLEDGRFALAVDIEDADRLEITLEGAGAIGEPQGPTVASVALRGAGADAGGGSGPSGTG